MTGDEALVYVEHHLQLVPLASGELRPELTWGNLTCPYTDHSWYWMNDPASGGPPQLWRYPLVLLADLERHEFVSRANDRFTEALTSGTDSRTLFDLANTVNSEAWRRYMDGLRVGSVSPEAAIVFLEVDPWYSGSGFEKQRVMRFVTRCGLSEEDCERLRQVIVTVTGKGPRADFATTALLAKRIWSAGLERDLTALAEADPTTSDAVHRLFRKRYTL